MPNCAVLNCKNSTKIVGRANGNISFHRFPSDPKVKEIWIEATGNKNWVPTKHSRICSVHFDNDNFTETNMLRRLTTVAIPTIDVLKTSISDENKDQQLTAKKLSSCITLKKIKLEKNKDQPTANKCSPCITLKKIKLEKDTHEPTSEEKPLDMPKNKLVYKLYRAQQIIKQKNKDLKRLREQNRRKGRKILTLMALIGCLKKEAFMRDEQANLLNTTNVTTNELCSGQMKVRIPILKAP